MIICLGLSSNRHALMLLIETSNSYPNNVNTFETAYIDTDF